MTKKKFGLYQDIDVYKHPSNVFFLRYCNYKINVEKKNITILVVGGLGCQPEGSKVLMVDGEWKNIENIKKGDLVLSPQKDGSHIYAKVINTVKWFSKDNYDVCQLHKQRKKLYSCSFNHLIPLFNVVTPRINKKEGKRYRIWKFKNWIVKKFSERSYSTKCSRKIGFSSFLIPKFKDRENCEIEPYTLGVFLGDGCFYHKVIIKQNKNYAKIKRKDKKFFHRKLNRLLAITTDDFEIMEEVSKYYPIKHINNKKGTAAKDYSFSMNGELPKLLTKYSLEGKKSGTKFIPKEALLSDSEYRKKLLAGLIDTDGYYKKGGYDITTKSKQLAEDILFLVYSLGGRGNIRKIKKRIKKLNFEGEYYAVSFYLKDLKLPLQVKKKIKDTSSFYLSSNRIAINPIKSNEEYYVYGFTLDSPSGWYITDNFMVTHNSGKSFASMAFMELLNLAGIGSKFGIDNVHFKARNFLAQIGEKDKDGNFLLKAGDGLIMDEAGIGIAARDWFTLVNKKILNILETFRYRRLVAILTAPDISFIDKKARRLLSMIFETKHILRKQEICIIKPLLISLSQREDKIYTPYYKYKNPIDKRIYKIGNLFLPLPSKELRKLYGKKKIEFATQLTEEARKDLERHEIMRKLNPIQRKILIIIHTKGDVGYTKIAELLGMKEISVYNNLKYVYYLLGKEYNEEPPKEKKEDTKDIQKEKRKKFYRGTQE